MMSKARGIVVVLALGLASSSSAEYVKKLNGTNSKVCGAEWQCPKDLYELCAYDSEAKEYKSFYNRCVLRCAEPTFTIKNKGLCYDDLKVRHEKCGKFDDQRIRCGSVTGCQFHPEIGGEIIGGGFVDGGDGPGVGGAAAQTLECWDLQPESAEEKFAVFTDRCAAVGKKLGEKQKCEASKNEIEGGGEVFYCEIKRTCKPELKTQKDCEGAGDGKSCEFETFKFEGKTESFCVEKMAAGEGAAGAGGGAAGEEGGEGMTGCFGFMPAQEQPAPEKGVVNDKGQTEDVYCNAVKDDNGNQLCQYTNSSGAAADGFEAPYLCEPYSKCHGKGFADCGKVDGCETAGTKDDFVGCFPAIVAAADSGVSCYTISDETNCKAQKSDGKLACAFTVQTEDVCWKKGENGDRDQVYNEVKGNKCDEGFTFKENYELKTCGDICEAQGTDEAGCKSAGCCFDSSFNFCSAKVNSKCVSSDTGLPGDDSGGDSGPDSTGGGAGGAASCAMVMEKGKCGGTDCEWKEEKMMTKCENTKGQQNTTFADGECMMLPTAKACEAVADCKPLYETNGYCGSNSPCEGVSVQAKCDEDKCFWLQDEIGGYCQDVDKIENDALNGTCKFDTFRVVNSGDEINEFIEGEAGSDSTNYDQDFEDFLYDGTGCASAKDATKCTAIKDELGFARCEYADAEDSMQEIGCYNKHPTIEGEDAPDCGAGDENVFNENCDRACQAKSCNLNAACKWRRLDNKTVTAGAKVCRTKELGEMEACARHSNSYTCDDVTGCRFEQNQDAGSLDDGTTFSGDGFSDSEEEMGEYFQCQQGIESKEKCEAIKDKKGAQVCAFTAFKGQATCQIPDKFFQGTGGDGEGGNGDNTVGDALPECWSATDDASCKKLGKPCEFIARSVYNCGIKPHVCTTLKKTACVQNDLCDYNPPNKGTCAVPQFQDPENLSDEEKKIEQFCTCDPSLESSLAYDKDACKAKGCEFYAAGGDETGVDSGLPGVESSATQLICTPKKKEDSSFGGAQEGGGDGGDGGYGAGAQYDQCACYKDKASKQCKAQTADPFGGGGGGGGDGGYGGGDGGGELTLDFQGCQGFQAKDACNAKKIEGQKGCAWVTQESQYNCQAKSVIKCAAAKSQSACTGDCKWEYDTCQADYDKTESDRNTCMGLEKYNDVGALDQKECETSDKCATAKIAEDQSFCAPYDKCGAITAAQVCDGTNGCEFNQMVKQCTASFTLPCETTECCNEVAFSGDGAEKACNKKKLTDGSRACAYTTFGDAAGGICVSASTEVGKMCNFSVVYDLAVSKGIQSACAATEFCEFAKEAAMDGTCMAYDTCNPPGSPLSKDACTKHANCTFLTDSITNDTMCLAKAVASGFGDEDGVNVDIDGGLITVDGDKFTTPCGVYFGEKQCNEAETKDSATPRCIYTDFLCQDYDVCRSSGANANERACNDAGACSFKRDSADSLTGTCGKAPKLVAGKEAGNYTCVPYMEDDFTVEPGGGSGSGYGFLGGGATTAATTTVAATGCCTTVKANQINYCLNDYTRVQCEEEEQARAEQLAGFRAIYWESGSCQVSDCDNLKPTAAPTTVTIDPDLAPVSAGTRVFIALANARVAQNGQPDKADIIYELRKALGLTNTNMPTDAKNLLTLSREHGGMVVSFAGVKEESRPSVKALKAGVAGAKGYPMRTDVLLQISDTSRQSGFRLEKKFGRVISTAEIFDGAVPAFLAIVSYPTVPPVTTTTLPVTAKKKTTATQARADARQTTEESSTSTSEAPIPTITVNLDVRCKYGLRRVREDCGLKARDTFLQASGFPLVAWTNVVQYIESGTNKVHLEFEDTEQREVDKAEKVWNNLKKDSTARCFAVAGGDRKCIGADVVVATQATAAPKARTQKKPKVTPPAVILTEKRDEEELLSEAQNSADAANAAVTKAQEALEVVKGNMSAPVYIEAAKALAEKNAAKVTADKVVADAQKAVAEKKAKDAAAKAGQNDAKKSVIAEAKARQEVLEKLVKANDCDEEKNADKQVISVPDDDFVGTCTELVEAKATAAAEASGGTEAGDSPSSSSGSSSTGQIVAVVIVMVAVLVAGIIGIVIIRRKMEERSMQMGSAMQTYGNPVYAQGPGGVDEAGDGYLDVAEGAKKPQNAAPAKKGLVRQESLC